MRPSARKGERDESCLVGAGHLGGRAISPRGRKSQLTSRAEEPTDLALTLRGLPPGTNFNLARAATHSFCRILVNDGREENVDDKCKPYQNDSDGKWTIFKINCFVGGKAGGNSG